MDKKISFVSTFIPADSYKEKEEFGNTVILRFDAKLSEDKQSYECVECSYSNDVTSEEDARKAYEEYKTKIASIRLRQAKREKLKAISEYDTSDKVNGFSLNGAVVWLDKATRVGLMNSTTIAKAAGNKTTTLWLGEMKLEVDCDKAIQLLSALEMYALQCFNVTAAHKAEVSDMTDVDKVLAYDVTAGYPAQLKMEV